MNPKSRDIDYVYLDNSRCDTISQLFPGSGYYCRTGYHMRRLNQAVPPVGIACMIALHQCSEADLGVRGKHISVLALIVNHKDPNRTLYISTSPQGPLTCISNPSWFSRCLTNRPYQIQLADGDVTNSANTQPSPSTKCYTQAPNPSGAVGKRSRS